ncbi:MAG: DUF5677 domain-containing protein [bacterium]
MNLNSTMSNENIDFIRDMYIVGKRMIEKLNESIEKDDVVWNSLHLLIQRIPLSCDSLLLLVCYARHNVNFDAPVILRSIYDAVLQGLYILNDPCHREERARLFLDYFWIEQHEHVRNMDKNPLPIALYIQYSPYRKSYEPELEREFARVKDKYLKQKGRLRGNWYPGNLRELAKQVNLEEEYDLLQKQLSGAVHSSPFVLKCGGTYFRGLHVLTAAILLLFRLLGQTAEFAGIALTDEERSIIERASGSIFGTVDEFIRESRVPEALRNEFLQRLADGGWGSIGKSECDE